MMSLLLPHERVRGAGWRTFAEPIVELKESTGRASGGVLTPPRGRARSAAMKTKSRVRAGAIQNGVVEIVKSQ